MYGGYSRVHGTDEYFESGEICTTYILPPNIGDSNVFFPLLFQKLGGNRPSSCSIGIRGGFRGGVWGVCPPKIRKAYVIQR
jgi:hypothetical protein